MADIACGLIPEVPVASGLADRRQAGMLMLSIEPASGLPDRRQGGVSLTLGSGGGGPTVTTYYSLRVRDDGVGPPAVYRIWSSTDPNSSPPGAPPVGAWVDRTVLDIWTL